MLKHGSSDSNNPGQVPHTPSRPCRHVLFKVPCEIHFVLSPLGLDLAVFKQTCPVIQVLLLLLPVEKDLEFAENMIVALAWTRIGVLSGADHGP